MHSDRQDNKYGESSERLPEDIGASPRTFELESADDDAVSPRLVLIAFLVAAVILTLTGVAITAFLSARDGHGDPQVTEKPDPGLASGVTWDPVLDCLQPGDCSQAPKELTQAFTDAHTCDGPGKRVCLVPLGAVSKELIDHLVGYYRDEYGLTVHVLPPISYQYVETRGHDGQVEASGLRASMHGAYPTVNDDPEAILVGLTSTDIFLNARPTWQWAFGQNFTFNRQGKNVRHQAVISTFRMDQRSWGYRANDKLYRTRVRKMMNKYVAVMYYGMPFSDDPRSITYSNIGGLGDLDRMDERIPVSR